MRFVAMAMGLLAMTTVACSASSSGDEPVETSEARMTAIPGTAVGDYYLRTPAIGATLKVTSTYPFRFSYFGTLKIHPEAKTQFYGVYDALASVDTNGLATYAPSADCKLTFKVRNDGVEVRQAGTCAEHGFTGGMDATGVYLPLPKAIGDCDNTAIALIGGRLEGDVDFSTGTTVIYENMLAGVSYEKVDAVARSQVGDEVRVCLVSIPSDCPPGDDRGKVYKATNLRTNESWELADSQHYCGGA